MDEIIIIWEPEALEMIKDHYRFLAVNNKKAAKNLVDSFFTSVHVLRVFPNTGQREPLLTDMPLDYRYLVVEKHFKVIYTVEIPQVTIHAVWDC